MKKLIASIAAAGVLVAGAFAVADQGIAESWGDFDEDGDLDAYLSVQGSPNRLVRNDQQTGNAWLQLEL